MIKNTIILLLLWAANFEPFQCIPVKSSFGFRFLASTACAVISSSEEVPIQARNFRWLRHHGFLNMGEGTAENVSEFQSQINPMSSVMTVNHNDNFITILVSLVTPYHLLLCPIHSLTNTEINHMCTIIAQHWSHWFFSHMMKQHPWIMHFVFVCTSIQIAHVLN